MGVSGPGKNTVYIHLQRHYTNARKGHGSEEWGYIRDAVATGGKGHSLYVACIHTHSYRDLHRQILVVWYHPASE